MPRIAFLVRAQDEAGNAVGGSSQQVRIYDDFACTSASVVTDDSAGGTTIAQPITPNAGTYTTLTVTTAAVDTTITVTSTTGFVVGQLIVIYDPTNTVYRFIRSILSGPPRLTLNAAVGFIFSTTNTQVGNLDQVGIVAGWVLDTSYHYAQVTDVASGRKGSPTLVSTQIGSANVGVLEEGAGGGTRPTINFIGSLSTAVDNPGASRVDVTVTMPAGTEALPGAAPTSDTDTGIWWETGNIVSIVALAKRVAQFQGIASAVNYVLFNPATAGAGPYLLSAGTDTNIDLNLSSKGTGNILLLAGGSARRLAQFADATSAVNYPAFIVGATGVAPQFMALGTDTNIDLTLVPKGTGVIRYKTGSQLWPLNSSSSVLAADVAMTSANVWYDHANLGLSLATGTWIVWATLTIASGNVASGFTSMRISDGTTHYATAESKSPAVAGDPVALSCVARITLGSTTTIKAQAVNSQPAGSILAATPHNSSGNTASNIVAFQVLTS